MTFKLSLSFQSNKVYFYTLVIVRLKYFTIHYYYSKKLRYKGIKLFVKKHFCLCENPRKEYYKRNVCILFSLNKSNRKIP